MAVRQLQSRSETFGFVMESLMIIEEKAGRLERLAPPHLIVRSTHDFGGEPQHSFVKQINAPPIWVIVVKGQIKC